MKISHVTFRTKACERMLLVSWKTTKKEEFAEGVSGEDLTISWLFEANDVRQRISETLI